MQRFFVPFDLHDRGFEWVTFGLPFQRKISRLVCVSSEHTPLTDVGLPFRLVHQAAFEIFPIRVERLQDIALIEIQVAGFFVRSNLFEIALGCNSSFEHFVFDLCLERSFVWAHFG